MEAKIIQPNTSSIHHTAVPGSLVTQDIWTETTSLAAGKTRAKRQHGGRSI